MNNDELQILGAEKPKKKNKVVFAIIALVALLAIGGIYYASSSKQPERIKTGKKMGESTIVPELQTAVDTILLKEMEMLDMLQGQAIVMEVQTGEILAMSGLERNFEGKYEPCKNFAYQQELGSLMKTASLLVALETGKANLSDVVDVEEGVWDVGNAWLMKDHNWRRGGYGKITLERALGVSSNIGISKTIWELFKGHEQDYFKMLDAMSFGQPNSIDGIDSLRPSVFSSPKDPSWINYDMLWSSIGYNRKIAPIQMLTFYNAIANNGKMVKPTLKVGETEVINPHIASNKNIVKIQTALEHVVSQGLGKKAGTQLLRVAGIPSTSQVGEFYFGEETSVTEYQIGFCGYFPADKPKYSMIISMNKLGLPASGGGMAGPVFHDIMEWMIAHGILPLSIINEATSDTINIAPNNIHNITDSLSKEQ